MSLNKPLESITENDLQALVDAQTAERRTMEYKQALPGDAVDDKKEFLADVSSFANAAGGNLLFGIEEQAGIPVSLTGILPGDVDAQKLRLENILRDGIAPRLPRVDIHAVPLTSKPGHYMLVLRIQKSWLSPHRVIFRDHGHFYSRNSAGKYRLDVTELRTAFELSGNTAERMRDFRADRLGKIVAGETPHRLEEQAPKLVLHLIPFQAFDPAVRFDPYALTADNVGSSLLWSLTFEEIDRFQQQRSAIRLNFDGLLCYRPRTEYVQIFRHGSIEAVNSFSVERSDNQRMLPGVKFERGFLQVLKRGLTVQQLLGVELPVFVMVSILGVAGCYIIPWVGTVIPTGDPIDRADLVVPEVVVDTFTPDYHQVMKPIFDTLWNASGYEGSASYTEDGQPSITRF
jgi:hypothetical protein